MKKFLFGLLLVACVFVQAVEIIPATHSCHYDSVQNCTIFDAAYLSGSLSNPAYAFIEKADATALIFSNDEGIVILKEAGALTPLESVSITEDDDSYFVAALYYSGVVNREYLEVYKVDKATRTSTLIINLKNAGAPPVQIVKAAKIFYDTGDNLIYSIAQGGTQVAVTAFYVNGSIRTAANTTAFWAVNSGATNAFVSVITNNSAVLTIGDDYPDAVSFSPRNLIDLASQAAVSIVYDPVNIIVATFLNSSHIVASTNSYGQYELIYFPVTCAGGCTPTRLTVTTADESPFASTDTRSLSAASTGANPIIFYSLNGAVMGKYLCDNNELADSCEDEASYGDAPVSAQMVAVDTARCMNSNPAECAANIGIDEYLLYGNAEYLVIQYKINDKIALPSVYTAGTSPSDAYTYANATCYYSSNGITWTALDWGLNTSTSYYAAWDSTQPAFVSGNLISLAETNLYIKCESGIYGSDATLSSRFILENTYPIQTDYYAAIGDENGYGFVLDENSNYLRFKLTRSGSAWSPYVLSNEWSLFGSTAFGGFYESTTNPLTYLGNQYLVPSSHFASFGYHRFKIDSRSLVSTTRFPTFERIQPVLYESSCDGFKDTSIFSPHLEHFFYGGDFGGLNEFEIGEDAAIGYSVTVGENTWDLIGTDLPFSEHSGTGYAAAGLSIPYSLCYLEFYNATSFVAGVPNWNYKLSNLPVGEYTAVINCEENALNTRSYLDCIGSDSLNYSFNVTANAGCAQTKNDCGIGGVCVACGTVTLDCESGNYTMQSECRYNDCDETALECPPSTKVYGLEIENDNELSCIGAQQSNPIRVFLTKFGATVAWSGVDTPSCNLYLEGEGIEDYFNPMIYNGQINAFERELAGEGLLCDSTYYLTAVCSSPDFDSSKIAYGAFNVLYADYCEYGNNFVPLGECVTAISGASADLPFYCNAAGNIVNNSATCGCPRGATANLTTGECDGAAFGNFLSGIYDFPWLSLGGILLILVFGGLFLIFLKVTKDEQGHYIIVQNKR